MTSQAVGVVGLGKMGLPMARHLREAGYDVFGYDVAPDTVEAARAAGIEPCATPADVAHQTAATFLVVGFDDEVKAACLGADGLGQGAQEGHAIFVCSTVAPQTVLDVAAGLRDRGVAVLDATLCRAEHAAVDGTLLVLGGGDRDLFERWQPAMETFATDVCHLGDLGAGQVGKMLNNLLLWINVVGNYEALRLGKRLGLDQDALIPALLLGSGANWALGTWHKSRPMPWAEKDLAICLDYADREGLPAPLSGVTREAMKLLKQGKASMTPDGVRSSMQEFVDRLEP